MNTIGHQQQDALVMKAMFWHCVVGIAHYIFDNNQLNFCHLLPLFFTFQCEVQMCIKTTIASSFLCAHLTWDYRMKPSFCSCNRSFIGYCYLFLSQCHHYSCLLTSLNISFPLRTSLQVVLLSFLFVMWLFHVIVLFHFFLSCFFIVFMIL